MLFLKFFFIVYRSAELSYSACCDWVSVGSACNNRLLPPSHTSLLKQRTNVGRNHVTVQRARSHIVDECVNRTDDSGLPTLLRLTHFITTLTIPVEKCPQYLIDHWLCASCVDVASGGVNIP